MFQIANENWPVMSMTWESYIFTRKLYASSFYGYMCSLVSVNKNFLPENYLNSSVQCFYFIRYFKLWLYINTWFPERENSLETCVNEMSSLVSRLRHRLLHMKECGFRTSFPHWNITEGGQGRNRCHGRLLLTFSRCLSRPAFFYQPRNTCPGVALPTMSYRLPTGQ